MAEVVRNRTGLNGIEWVALALTIIGALNWGLVGLFGFNLVSALFGATSTITRVVYTLVGLSGLYTTYLATRLSPRARL